MLKPLPVILVARDSSLATPPGFPATAVREKPVFRSVRAMEIMTALEHRVKTVLKSPLDRRLLNIDAPSSHALMPGLSHQQQHHLLHQYYDPFHQALSSACREDSMRLGLLVYILEDSTATEGCVLSLDNGGDSAGEKKGRSLTGPPALLRDLYDVACAVLGPLGQDVRLNVCKDEGYIAGYYYSPVLPWIRLGFHPAFLMGGLDRLFERHCQVLQEKLQSMITYLFSVEGWLPEYAS